MKPVTNELKNRCENLQVITWPPPADSELDEIFCKLAWFIPYNFSQVKEIVLFTDLAKKDIKPVPHCYQRVMSSDHIRLTRVHGFDWNQKLEQVILALRNFHQVKAAFPGKHVLDVSKNSPDWGMWASLLPRLRNISGNARVNSSKKILQGVLERMKDKVRIEKKRVVLVGTGPGLSDFDSIFGKDRDALFFPVNGVALDKNLFSRMNPEIYFAGDALWHVGASLYSEVFRAEIVKRLEENKNTLWVTLEKHAELLQLHLPEIADRIVGVPQASQTTNISILKDFRLPALDGALNTWLFPAGFTVSKTVEILGCNGGAESRASEFDFWPHHLQLADLLWTGHQLHPQFGTYQKTITQSRNRKETQVWTDFLENQSDLKAYRHGPTDIPGLVDLEKVRLG